MLERLVCALVHPSKIGKFHKDKIIIPILFLLASIALYIGLFAVIVFNNSFFNSTSYNSLTNRIIFSETVSDVSYNSSTKKMTGSKTVYSGNSLLMQFMNNDFDPKTNEAIAIVFLEDHIDEYFASTKVATINYADYDFSSYSLKSIKENTGTTNILAFEDMIEVCLEKAEQPYRVSYFLSNLWTYILFLGISAIAALLFSFYANNDIAFEKRLKLLFYDLVSYSIVMFFSALFAIQFLEYAALAVPVIYASISFRHIRRKRRVDVDEA